MHRRTVVLAGFAALLVSVAVGSPSGATSAKVLSASAVPRVEITSFSHKGIYPVGITVGADGALWFTNGDSIGRITTRGGFSFFKHKRINASGGIAAGPDGALWFTNGDSIGRITTRGAVTVYRDKRIRHLGSAIATGPDGALWFTMYSEEAMYDGEADASGIGRITTDGKVIVYREGIDGPGGITAGPDRALWFTMFNYKRPYAGIGRITTRGGVTATSLDSGEADGIGPSLGITVGPDRAVWFTHPRSDFDSIGRITGAGKVSIYRHGSIGSPNAITAGPDGALWFTNESSIGRITTSGAVRAYKDKSIRGPDGITVGPDRALWFANTDGKSIGRLWIVSQG